MLFPVLLDTSFFLCLPLGRVFTLSRCCYTAEPRCCLTNLFCDPSFTLYVEVQNMLSVPKPHSLARFHNSHIIIIITQRLAMLPSIFCTGFTHCSIDGINLLVKQNLIPFKNRLYYNFNSTLPLPC